MQKSKKSGFGFFLFAKSGPVHTGRPLSPAPAAPVNFVSKDCEWGPFLGTGTPYVHSDSSAAHAQYPCPGVHRAIATGSGYQLVTEPLGDFEDCDFRVHVSSGALRCRRFLSLSRLVRSGACTSPLAIRHMRSSVGVHFSDMLAAQVITSSPSSSFIQLLLRRSKRATKGANYFLL